MKRPIDLAIMANACFTQYLNTKPALTNVSPVTANTARGCCLPVPRPSGVKVATAAKKAVQGIS